MTTTTTIYHPEVLADDLARAIRASQNTSSIRAVFLGTHDRDQAIATIKQAAIAAQRPLHHFTVSGKRRWSTEHVQWDSTSNASADFHELLHSADELKGGGIVIFEDGLPFLRDENGDLRARDRFRTMISAEMVHDGLVLIFLEAPESEAYLPSIARDRFLRLNVPHPRSADLEDIAREEIAKAIHRSQKTADTGLVRDAAARMGTELVGLTRSAARDAVRDALAPAPADFDGACKRLRRGKGDLLSRDLAMKVLDTDTVEFPIGMPFLLDYLKLQRARMRTEGPGRARGVLLIGPPGTGKTMLAKAIGRLVGLPVVEFRISSLMNSLLGETEARFARAFATIEAMAPNVVFIDEIEKAFGDSSERDGGTMMRCTGSLLSWLSDNPNPNFIVATSKSLRRMGEIGLTMTRSERFDAAYFLDVPSADARQKMLERWLGNHIAEPLLIAKDVAGVTDKFSGADLFSLVKHAAARAENRGCQLTLELLRAEVERKRTRAIALYDEFQELRRWGRTFCEPAGPTDH